MRRRSGYFALLFLSHRSRAVEQRAITAPHQVHGLFDKALRPTAFVRRFPFGAVAKFAVRINERSANLECRCPFIIGTQPVQYGEQKLQAMLLIGRWPVDARIAGRRRSAQAAIEPCGGSISKRAMRVPRNHIGQWQVRRSGGKPDMMRPIGIGEDNVPAIGQLPIGQDDGPAAYVQYIGVRKARRCRLQNDYERTGGWRP